MTRLRHNLLFISADKSERIEKAASLPADVVAIELGDWVAPQNKEFARKEPARTIEQVDFCYKELVFRVN
jgi:citrate lyase beta subunit